MSCWTSQPAEVITRKICVKSKVLQFSINTRESISRIQLKLKIICETNKVQARLRAVILALGKHRELCSEASLGYMGPHLNTHKKHTWYEHLCISLQLRPGSALWNSSCLSSHMLGLQVCTTTLGVKCPKRRWKTFEVCAFFLYTQVSLV